MSTPNLQEKERAARRMARLAAVQGLYRIALTEHSPEQIIRDFEDHPPPLTADQKEGGNSVPDLDRELFGVILLGVANEPGVLDAAINSACDTKVSAERFEILLRAILRAGAYELLRHPLVPRAAIINDYIDITHAFFEGKEPGLVNAVLDRLSKQSRE